MTTPIHRTGQLTTIASALILNLALSAALLWSVPARCVAQPPFGLNLQTYAGLTITGAVGTVYTVQSTTNLAQPDWRGAGVVELPSSPYLWVDTTAPATGQRYYRAVAGPTNLAWIPPGTFTMGSPSTELERFDLEGPQTVVTLTRGFFIGKYELTQEEYVAVMGNNPSSFRNGTAAWGAGTGDAVTNDLRHPVEGVTWDDATNYCGRLTERERVAGRLPGGWVYRLPTEAEWEYACRSGTTSPFHYGPALHSGMANFVGFIEHDSSVGRTTNAAGIWLGRTTVVGSYEANGWGLYDMHGNVEEFCSDWWYYDGLPGGSVIDPQGPDFLDWWDSPKRVIRGGGWGDDASYSRSAFREGFGLGSASIGTIGFRVVLAPGQ